MIHPGHPLIGAVTFDLHTTLTSFCFKAKQSGFAAVSKAAQFSDNSTCYFKLIFSRCPEDLASDDLRNLLEIKPEDVHTTAIPRFSKYQPQTTSAMVEVSPEQTNSQLRGTAQMFDQKPHAGFAGSSKQPGDDDSKAPLPKGVVLDKDGKP